MGRLVLASLSALMLLAAMAPAGAAAQRHPRVVVRRGPVRRTTIVVHPGHPIRRALPSRVVVRTPRTAVVVRAPLVFRPALIWVRSATVLVLPAHDQLIWEDTETIDRDEEWVDANFGVDQRGTQLFLDLDGRAKLSFAEVTFENGEVQVVDFEDQTHDKGLYSLLDFRDGRRVMTVRVLARSETPETTLKVYLRT
ncbi:MAG TPA: hypothetical protein VFU23_07680 [Gemmatimonadales bacterium]|nr:hypothetical protein [Gemmatimonadales bacterium]